MSRGWCIPRPGAILALVGGMLAIGMSAGLAADPFYKGKRLTVLINFAAGGPTDIEGRLFAKHLARHIEGEPGIVVQNMEGAGGIVGAKFLGEVAPRDGTTAGYLTGTAFQYALDPERFRIDYRSYQFVAIQPGTTVHFMRTDVPPGIKEPADLVKAQGIIAGGLSVDTPKDIRMRLLFDMLGLSYKYVTGYRSSPSARLAFQRGEINVFAESPPSYRSVIAPTLVKRGEAIPIFYDPGWDGRDYFVPGGVEGLDVIPAHELYRKIKGAPPSGPLWDIYRAILGADGITQRAQEAVQCGGLAPHQGDLPARRRIAERHQLDVRRLRDRFVHRQRRQQGHADAGGDHLPQGFQAGGAEAGFFVRAGQPAHVERLVAQAMAVFQQQQGFVRELRHRQRFLPGQRMLVRRGEQERLLEQRLRVQLVVVQGQREQRGIQLALAQALQEHVALFLDQQQFKLREALAQLRHHVRQQVRAQGGEHAQPQRSGFRIHAAPRGFLHFVDLGHDPSRALHHVLPGGGQHHLARRAFHQRDAQFVLQLPDLGGQRRLADEAGIRRLAEVAQVGQRNEVLQVAQVHVAGPFNSMVLPSGSSKYSEGPSPSAPKLLVAGPRGASPCRARWRTMAASSNGSMRRHR